MFNYVYIYICIYVHKIYVGCIHRDSVRILGTQPRTLNKTNPHIPFEYNPFLALRKSLVTSIWMGFTFSSNWIFIMCHKNLPVQLRGKLAENNRSISFLLEKSDLWTIAINYPWIHDMNKINDGYLWPSLEQWSKPLFHRENGGTLGMVPLLFNPPKEPLRKGYTVANINIL